MLNMQQEVTFSEINHSAPITETNRTKIIFSAILTPFVIQKTCYLQIISAKTSLASYLL